MPEEGLAAYNGDYLMPAPARKMVSGEGTEGDTETMEVNAEGIGPSVELVLGNGNGTCHAVVPPNGHDGEAGEPKRGNGKLQPATASLFEWALELERERAKETGRMGRRPATMGETVTASAAVSPCPSMCVVSLAFQTI